MEKVFELSCRGEAIRLPINPVSCELSSPSMNQTVTLVELGEINLFGNRGLKSIMLESFFPGQKSPFYSRASSDPEDYVARLEKWKNSKKPVRIIIMGTGVNMACAIERFAHRRREGDGDVYYTLELKEYRPLNVAPVAEQKSTGSSGLKSRPDTKENAREVVVKSVNDTLWSMACKFYGDGTRWTELASANNISDPKLMQLGDRVVIP